MRRREDGYLRSIWNGRDWLERKRPFSNSRQFKKKNISNSLILDKYIIGLRLVRLVIIVSSSTVRCEFRYFRVFRGQKEISATLRLCV